MRIFVTGTGRCGTHSYAEALGRTPLFATHEKFPGARMISNRRWDGDISETEALDAVRDGLGRFSDRENWCECSCLVWNFADLLHRELGGDVLFVHVVRDRVEVTDSMCRTGFCATGRLPWAERAHSGFFDCEAPGYDDGKRYRNCIHAVDIRLDRIRAALADIPETQSVTVEIGRAGFETACEFIRRGTSLEFGTPSLKRLSRTS